VDFSYLVPCMARFVGECVNILILYHIYVIFGFVLHLRSLKHDSGLRKELQYSLEIGLLQLLL